MKRLLTSILFALPLGVFAQTTQSANDNNNWKINEVYVSDAEKRYGLFVELYNEKSPKGQPYDYYLSISRKDPYQMRLRSGWKFHIDGRQKGYMAYRVSVIRHKRKSAKFYGHPDSLFLFKRIDNQFVLKDKFPVLWSDSLSVGRCDGRLCYFNMPTPGRVNKNVNPHQNIQRRNYRASLLLGGSNAGNTGFANVTYYPSATFKVQKVINRRTFYTGTSAAIFYQGYTFNENALLPSSQYNELIRSVKGNYSAFGLWAGKDIGMFLTPRFDISCGAGLIFGSYSQQKYSETLTGDGTVIDKSPNQTQTIENYGLPILTFNAGLNYQLTRKWKIEFFHNIYFRTFSKNETIYYKSFTIGVSHAFMEKGRGYKEGAGIFNYLF
jgi:hypothetical protein